MSSALLCNLPPEILDHILDYAVPVRRLTGRRPRDPEWMEHWQSDTRQPKPLPPLFFVNKILSTQALANFYDKAILDIQVIRPPQFICDALQGGLRLSVDLTVEPSVIHAFCPVANLSRIKRVYIYSGQSDAVVGEGYEATLRWLMQNTAVRDVHLSRLLMTRLRKTRVDLDRALSALNGSKPTLVSTVYVWTRHARSLWETTRMREMTKIAGVAPPLLQLHLYRQDSDMDAVLDPRWDLRSSDTVERRTASKPVVDFLDALASKDELYQMAEFSNNVPTIGMRTDRLYQVVFIVGSP